MKIRVGNPVLRLMREIVFPVILQRGINPDDDEDQLVAVCFRETDANKIKRALEQSKDIYFAP